MGKLTKMAMSGMVLATLGLAGCKCCHKHSSDSCCTSSTSSHQTSATQPQGLPTVMPASNQPTSKSSSGQIQSYQSMPQGMPGPANSPSTGWNTVNRMPQGQTMPLPKQPTTVQSMPTPAGPGTIHQVPANQVMPANATDTTGDNGDDSVTPSSFVPPPAPTPVRSGTPISIPSMSEKMQQQGIQQPPRPREGF